MRFLERLHIEEISKKISSISKIENVRKQVIKHQRKIAEKKNIVVEGRDIGTVVFPNAKYKFFLTADIVERARRRKKQFGEYSKIDISEIIKNLEQRDYKDQHCLKTLLQLPKDTFLIDTTNNTIDEITQKILRVIKLS